MTPTTVALSQPNACENCETEAEADERLCKPCQSILMCDYYKPRLWNEREGLVNRRWQMRFNRGELEEHQEDTSVLWITKKKDQLW